MRAAMICFLLIYAESSANTIFQSALDVWKYDNLKAAFSMASERLTEMAREEKGIQNIEFWHPWELQLRARERSRLLIIIAYGFSTHDPVSASKFIMTAVHGQQGKFRLFMSGQPDALVWQYAKILDLRYKQVFQHDDAPIFDFVNSSGWGQFETNIPFPQLEQHPDPNWLFREPLVMKNVHPFLQLKQLHSSSNKFKKQVSSALNQNHKFDVCIPCSSADFNMLPLTISLLRKNVANIDTIYIVSAEKTDFNKLVRTLEEAPPLKHYDLQDNSMKWISEELYPINRLEMRKDIFQQVLKLLFQFVVKESNDNVLVCDADVLWLNPSLTFINQGQLLYTSANHAPFDVHRRRDGGFGYPEFVESMLGYGKFNESTTAIAHHMMMNRQSLQQLFKAVAVKAVVDEGKMERRFKPAWIIFIEMLIFNSTPRSSEYELYHSFVFHQTQTKLLATDDVRVPDVSERSLKWDDWGACCHDRDGLWISPVRATNLIAKKQFEEDGVYSEPSTGYFDNNWCDLDILVEGLGRHFDYIACHRHLRPIMR